MFSRSPVGGKRQDVSSDADDPRPVGDSPAGGYREGRRDEVLVDRSDIEGDGPFDRAEPGSLADQVDSFIDEDGDDIRMYTGEPVETDEGWVIPVQQNVGGENMAGGGEWPDPDTPRVEPPTGDTAESPDTAENPDTPKRTDR